MYFLNTFHKPSINNPEPTPQEKQMDRGRTTRLSLHHRLGVGSVVIDYVSAGTDSASTPAHRLCELVVEVVILEHLTDALPDAVQGFPPIERVWLSAWGQGRTLNIREPEPVVVIALDQPSALRFDGDFLQFQRVRDGGQHVVQALHLVQASQHVHLDLDER